MIVKRWFHPLKVRFGPLEASGAHGCNGAAGHAQVLQFLWVHLLIGLTSSVFVYLLVNQGARDCDT